MSLAIFMISVKIYCKNKSQETYKNDVKFKLLLIMLHKTYLSLSLRVFQLNGSYVTTLADVLTRSRSNLKRSEWAS